MNYIYIYINTNTYKLKKKEEAPKHNFLTKVQFPRGKQPKRFPKHNQSLPHPSLS